MTYSISLHLISFSVAILFRNSCHSFIVNSYIELYIRWQKSVHLTNLHNKKNTIKKIECADRMNSGDIVSFTSLDLDIQGLIKESATAREYSYAPYSKFKVGAAILCTDGRIFRGCNVENMSYPVGICAERTAITKAVSEGSRNFKAIAVVADQVNNIYTTPCGVCRQTVIEFGNITVYCTTPNMKEVLRTTMNDLIPFAFTPQNM